jgi:tRNA pseudouridine55 synthase
MLDGSAMNAIILVDKPAGITSAEAVRRLKRRVKPSRVGHLGTLDPFATGLLPIMIGEATKLAPFLEGGDKEYQGIIRLGVETDTLDREGEVVRTAEIPELDAGKLREVAARFTGRITQTPPVFSAIKRAGVPLYRLARRGEVVEPPAPREVEIFSLALELAGAGAIRFSARCSTGTYARSLARDIGAALGSAAHLEDLRRTRSGRFSIDDAAPLDRVLCALDSGDLTGLPVVTMRAALPDLPEIRVDGEVEARLRNGDSRALTSMIPKGAAPLFKVIAAADGELIAVARATTLVTAAIERIFVR